MEGEKLTVFEWIGLVYLLIFVFFELPIHLYTFDSGQTMFPHIAFGLQLLAASMVFGIFAQLLVIDKNDTVDRIVAAYLALLTFFAEGAAPKLVLVTAGLLILILGATIGSDQSLRELFRRGTASAEPRF